jgi:hypothetical protein
VLGPWRVLLHRRPCGSDRILGKEGGFGPLCPMKSKAYYSERVGVIQGQIASKSSELEFLRGELD